MPSKPVRKTLFDAGKLESGASFSECRKYRWTLWRRWDPNFPPCVFIGLNPSTADETEDDPTIRRCIGFAKSWNLGGLIMLNAFGYRATLPKDMKAAADPVGVGNDKAIELTAQMAIDAGGIVVAAWGTHCEEERASTICGLINRKIHCLGRTMSGRPKHPLYLRSETRPEVFWQPLIKNERRSND